LTKAGKQWGKRPLFCFSLLEDHQAGILGLLFKEDSCFELFREKIRKKSPDNGGQYMKFNAVTIQFCENKRIARKPCNICLYC